MRKIALFILLLLLRTTSYCQHMPVAYYVVAEQDQWALFMGTNAWMDIASAGNAQNKVVIIYITAGDESCNGTLNTHYYIARQRGADMAVEFCADQNQPHEFRHDTLVSVNGHLLNRNTYKNVTSYCLRLPGGCTNGGLNGESLKLLHNGAISSITAVDSSASYSGWNDLENTLHKILTAETHDTTSDLVFNTADTSTTLNPGDRPDHIFTAKLLLGALRHFDNYKLNLYSEYSIAILPANLTDKEIANKAALLSELDFARTENGQPSEWTPATVDFLSRNYFRTIIRHDH